MSALCVLCRAQPGNLVCQDCQDDLDRQLRDLPARLARIDGELAPGSTPDGERVSGATRVHANLPARLSALSLVGPGAEVPVQLHPLVRHWSVKRKVQVTTHIVGLASRTEVEVTDWFHEAIVGADGRPVLTEVPDTDQIGLAPPREWLDVQVRRWRSHFGHHVPARTMLGAHRTWTPPEYRTLLLVPGGPQAIALLAATHRASGAQHRLAYRGLLAEHPDPATADIERRGQPARTVNWDVDYLRAWLPKACEQETLDLPGFAAQLHTLHAEIGQVLADTPEQTWVGRCPAFIDELDPDGQPTGRKRPCGGGLWQENGARISAQVVCPRCRITWETRGHAGAGTAREIRRVWPVDRRRRYKAAEIDRLRVPNCPDCGQRVKIVWREVTGTRDPARTWQPRAVSCPAGCGNARRLL